MNEDDSWRRSETPSKGPSAPRDLNFNPIGTAVGVFAAIAIPVFVVGYTRPAGPNGTIMLVGVVAGLLVGFLAGLWVGHRGGRVWRGPDL